MIKPQTRIHPCLVLLAIGAVVLLAATLPIQPTFDDWVTLSCPNYDPHFLQYFLPIGVFWRPGDALMGYVNAIDYRLFPALNHILIWAAHTASTLMVYLIARQLGMQRLTRYIGATFFFFSPCMLATTLSVDALNQSYCHLWGIMSVWVYLGQKGRRKMVLWMVLVLLSTFAKDNGLAWAMVAPFVAWGFRRTDRATLKRHLKYGMGLAAAYCLVRLAFPVDYTAADEHVVELKSAASKLSGLAKWLGYTWTATDFLALFYQPDRNLPLAAATCALSLPFPLLLLTNARLWRNTPFYVLVAAMFIVASPNIIISMSLMNAYASLGMAALLVAWMAQMHLADPGRRKALCVCFALYVACAVVTDTHHWYKAWKTSLTGRSMAENTVRRMHGKANNVYCITIRRDTPKYSSFCVPPEEAFGWGRAVWQVTGYTWPTTLRDTLVDGSPTAHAHAMALAHDKLKQGCDCVWIVDRSRVEVVR